MHQAPKASADASPDATSNVVKGSVSSLKRLTAVAAVDHTVKLQWGVSGVGAAASILISFWRTMRWVTSRGLLPFSVSRPVAQ